MSFSEFLNIIINCFTGFFNFFVTIFNLIIDNNFIKLILFIVLLYIIIDYFGDILSFIKNIFSVKKIQSKNKVDNNTDIE